MKNSNEMVLSSWGPEDRIVYDWEQRSSVVTFNSIVNNPYLGDERSFVRIRKIEKNGRELEEVNDVELEVNSKYKVSVYYHNDAREELNDDGSGISRNTSLRIVCPSHINVGEVGVVTGYINASNTTPNEIWASVYLKTCSNTNIRFVPNTAYIHNSGTTDGIQLSGDALMSSGVF